jgi:hypothetical protein
MVIPQRIGERGHLIHKVLCRQEIFQKSYGNDINRGKLRFSCDESTRPARCCGKLSEAVVNIFGDGFVLDLAREQGRF